MTVQCARCGRQLADGAAVCHDDAQALADALKIAAGHAEDAEAVITRQARYGTGGSGGDDDPLPVDLTAAAKFARVEARIGTWARVVAEETGQGIPRWRPLAGPTCHVGVRCPHESCAAVRRRWPFSATGTAAQWLAGQVEWLRHHPAAGEAFDELHEACDDLARLVDRPAEKDLVGMCDCGRVLYAVRGRTTIQCPVPTCKLTWNVERSREILRQALDGKLVTAAEAARLGQYLDTDRTQEQIRKLVAKWAQRGQLLAHGELQAEPAYRFGDVADRLARTPRRQRERMSA